MQLIERHRNQFRLKINGIDCLFMPIELWKENELLPLKKIVKGSTLGWHIKRNFVSYNQIKKIILS